MAGKDVLAEYRGKRKLSRSGEPAGSTRRGKYRQPQFVVQRHHATSLHFDFRLEIAGVLVSWSVPKGPSTNPADRRLALRTEDHPLDYADFEGRIPQGEYGGGTVIVWDTGTFGNLTEQAPEMALEQGHLRVWLHGDKLRGAYSLVRTQTGSEEGKQQWLLVKKADEGADRKRKPAKTQPESVLSGRRNDEL